MWRSDLGCPNMEEIPASKNRKQLMGVPPRFRLANILETALHCFLSNFWSQVLFSDQSTSEAAMVAPSAETQWRFSKSGQMWFMRQPEKKSVRILWSKIDCWVVVSFRILIKYLSFKIKYKMYKFSGVIPENVGYFCKNLTCAYIFFLMILGKNKKSLYLGRYC